MTCSCNTPRHLPKGVTRRDVMRFGAAAAGVVALGPLGGMLGTAHGAPLNKKRLIIINQFGGSDTTNMVIPHTLQPYYDRRSTISIQQSDALSLNVGPGANLNYSLHPRMTAIHSRWAAGNVAAINRIGYPSANLSHFISQDMFSTGVRNGFQSLPVSESGWIARYADRNAPTALGAVSVGVGRPLDFIGGSSNPFLVQSLAAFSLRTTGQAANTNEATHRAETAKNIVKGFNGVGNSQEAGTALGQAYDLVDQVQQAVGDFNPPTTFPTHRIGREMKDIATLIEAGFETDIFFTGTGGFDLHGNEGGTTGRQADLLGQIDEAIAAFHDYAVDRNLWDDTVIILMTEFGRRNFENGSNGTDHGHGYCELVMGGNVNGGMYGPDLTEADLNQNWLSYGHDFRSVYREVLEGHMGAVDLDHIFPETYTHNPLGIV